LSGAVLGMIAGAAVTPLSVLIGGGAITGGTATSHNFGNNTAVGKGGSGGYTYAWAVTSVVGGTWSASPSTGSLTTVSVSGVLINGSTSMTLVCTVTDAKGNTAQASTGYTYFNSSET
jgi:ABC-type transport system involved in multi-copper enzyme maturation permease subunit